MSEANIDLTKVLFDSRRGAFNNTNQYTGTLTASGSWTSGYNQMDFSVTMDSVPDMVTAVFNGPTDTVFASDPRPGAAWFKRGYIWILGDNAGAGYNGYPIPYRVTVITVGTTATIRLTSVSQISPTLVLRSTAFSYRIIDYSVL